VEVQIVEAQKSHSDSRDGNKSDKSRQHEEKSTQIEVRVKD
jgi:hypothetical protein